VSDLRGGIDLGGTKIQTVVVDGDSEVRGKARQATPTDGGPADVAAAMAEGMREAAEDAGVSPGELQGIGVGSPGDADGKTGVVSTARNLPGWEGSFPLGETLAEALGAEVRIGNDVQVAVDGEHRLGVGREYPSLLGVWWGTGVGGGIVLDGKSWLGRGAAGEIGHIVVERDGASCPCGRKGCMEAYAGRKAMELEARKRHEEGHKTDLFKLMEKHGKPRLTSGIWERALDHGDHLAKKLIERAIGALGTGVASACNVLDVEAVVIGGGLGDRLGERYMDELKAEMHKHLFTSDDPPHMQVAELGDLGGAIGATLLVR